MFGRLFKRFQPTTVQDPTFGALTCDRQGDWRGRITFTPLGKEMDISIRRTPDTPPTLEDRGLFNEICERWPAIHRNLRDTLFEDLDDLEDGTTMEQVFDSLDFEEIVFWKIDTRPRQWEISATTPHDGHTFGIMMEEFENAGFRMDG